MNGLVGVRAHGSRQRPDRPLEAVGPANDGGHGAAVEGLGQSVAGGIALKRRKKL